MGGFIKDYAIAGYRLQSYEISFYRYKDKRPIVVHRAFVNKKCADNWALEVLHHNRQYVDFKVEKMK